MAYVKINDEHLTNYANSIRQAKNNNKHYTPEQLEDEIQGLAEKTIEQETTITRQNNTIDQLNHREPKLETLDPINPSQEQVTYRPSGDNVGFNPFTVNPPTAEGVGFNPDYYKEGETCLGEVGTYNPFPEQSYGGIYILEKTEDGYPERVLIKDYFAGDVELNRIFPSNSSNIRANLKELLIKNVSSLASVNIPRMLVLKTLVVDAETVISAYGLDNCPALETLLAYKVTTFETSMVRGCTNLKTIHIPNSLISIAYDTFTAYPYSTVLEFVTIEPGFNCNNLNLSKSTLYSVETIVSWLEALADRTGETAYTLTMGSTNLNKMTAEEIAIATNKNWNIA